MDCRDVIQVCALINGKGTEVGKGIVMGLAGSKFGRKVIPNGWSSIKFTADTCSGSGESCPFPAGWTDMKQQTVREANGKTVVWPNSLLHKLLENYRNDTQGCIHLTCSRAPRLHMKM